MNAYLHPSYLLAAAVHAAEPQAVLFHNLPPDEIDRRVNVGTALLAEVQSLGRDGLTNERAKALVPWVNSTLEAQGLTPADVDAATDPDVQDLAKLWLWTASNLAGGLFPNF